MVKTWYAVTTRSRNEKTAFHLLEEAGIEAYLPLVKTLKQWSDRKKWVHEPLFKSYLFVHISNEQHYKVLNAQGIIKYVSFEGRAVAVPPQQIAAIMHYLDYSAGFPYDNDIDSFTIGKEVEVTIGPMKGLRGKLIQKAGKHKVKVEIDVVAQSVYLSLPLSCLKKL